MYTIYSSGDKKKLLETNTKDTEKYAEEVLLKTKNFKYNPVITFIKKNDENSFTIFSLVDFLYRDIDISLDYFNPEIFKPLYKNVSVDFKKITIEYLIKSLVIAICSRAKHSENNTLYNIYKNLSRDAIIFFTKPIPHVNLRDHFKKFPGIQPITIKNGMVNRGKEYGITQKLDGERYMMFSVNLQMVLFNKNFDVIHFPYKIPEDFKEFVFDGELYDGEYFIFDVMSNDPLSSRVCLINQFLSKLKPTYALNSKIIHLKNYKITNNVFKTMRNMIPKLKDNHDGLIIVDSTSGYKSSNPLKWKKIITFDFLLSMKEEIYDLYYLMMLTKQGIFKPFDEIVIPYKPFVNGTIVECYYKDGKWVLLRTRPDKNLPNYELTVRDNWEAVQNPFLYEEQNILQKPNEKENIIQNMVDEFIKDNPKIKVTSPINPEPNFPLAVVGKSPSNSSSKTVRPSRKSPANPEPNFPLAVVGKSPSNSSSETVRPSRNNPSPRMELIPNEIPINRSNPSPRMELIPSQTTINRSNPSPRMELIPRQIAINRSNPSPRMELIPNEIPINRSNPSPRMELIPNEIPINRSNLSPQLIPKHTAINRSKPSPRMELIPNDTAIAANSLSSLSSGSLSSGSLSSGSNYSVFDNKNIVLKGRIASFILQLSDTYDNTKIVPKQIIDDIKLNNNLLLVSCLVGDRLLVKHHETDMKEKRTLINSYKEKIEEYRIYFLYDIAEFTVYGHINLRGKAIIKVKPKIVVKIDKICSFGDKSSTKLVKIIEKYFLRLKVKSYPISDVQAKFEPDQPITTDLDIIRRRLTIRKIPSTFKKGIIRSKYNGTEYMISNSNNITSVNAMKLTIKGAQTFGYFINELFRDVPILNRFSKKEELSVKVLNKMGINIDARKCQKKRQPRLMDDGEVALGGRYINIGGKRIICDRETEYKYPGFTKEGGVCCFTKDQQDKEIYKKFVNANLSNSRAGTLLNQETVRQILAKRPLLKNDKILLENQRAKISQQFLLKYFPKDMFLLGAGGNDTIKNCIVKCIGHTDHFKNNLNLIVVSIKDRGVSCKNTYFYEFPESIILVEQDKKFSILINNKAQFAMKNNSFIKLIQEIYIKCFDGKITASGFNKLYPEPIVQVVNPYGIVKYVLSKQHGIIPVANTYIDPRFKTIKVKDLTLYDNAYQFKAVLNLIKLYPDLDYLMPVAQVLDVNNFVKGIETKSGDIIPVLPGPSLGLKRSKKNFYLDFEDEVAKREI